MPPVNLKPFFDAAQLADQKVVEIANEINTLFSANTPEGTEAARKKRPLLDAAKAEATEANNLYLSMRSAGGDGSDPAKKFVPMGGDTEPKAQKDMRASNEYFNLYWDAFKAGVSPKTIKAGMHSAEKYQVLMALTETGGSPAGAEGGFLNPIDFDGKIIELKRQFTDLKPLFNVETVTAYSGWRSVENATALLPFALMTENTDMAETEEPTFRQVNFTMKDYGGWIPVSNDLLSDTPVNIMNYLARWMSKKVVLTDNSLILTLLNALSASTITDISLLLDAIKTALNTTLDPDVSVMANIITNQSGFGVLDTLKDGDGRAMLQPDPVNSTKKTLYGRPITVLADRLWGNTSGKARIGVGSADYLTFFERAAYEMATTAIGGNAWRRNNTEVRGIMRADVKEIDTSNMVLIKTALS